MVNGFYQADPKSWFRFYWFIVLINVLKKPLAILAFGRKRCQPDQGRIKTYDLKFPAFISNTFTDVCARLCLYLSWDLLRWKNCRFTGQKYRALCLGNNKNRPIINPSGYTNPFWEFLIFTHRQTLWRLICVCLYVLVVWRPSNRGALTLSSSHYRKHIGFSCPEAFLTLRKRIILLVWWQGNNGPGDNETKLFFIRKRSSIDKRFINNKGV